MATGSFIHRFATGTITIQFSSPREIVSTSDPVQFVVNSIRSTYKADSQIGIEIFIVDAAGIAFLLTRQFGATAIATTTELFNDRLRLAADQRVRVAVDRALGAGEFVDLVAGYEYQSLLGPEVEWDQIIDRPTDEALTGPQGPQGPQGPAGVAGVAGAAGAAGWQDLGTILNPADQVGIPTGISFGNALATNGFPADSTLLAWKQGDSRHSQLLGDRFGSNLYWRCFHAAGFPSGSPWRRVWHDGNLTPLTQESGSWTPTLKFGGNSVGWSSGTATGRYFKVGKLVSISLVLISVVKNVGTGAMTIGGLPFTSLTTPAASLASQNISTQAAFGVYLATTNNELIFQIGVTNFDYSQCPSNIRLILSVTYEC